MGLIDKIYNLECRLYRRVFPKPDPHWMFEDFPDGTMYRNGQLIHIAIKRFEAIWRKELLRFYSTHIRS